ncbi:sensor histidine kinase, partial [Vibrio parahaemolyticus]|uniref:sensor histidine kinase n=1 Tax=Vibrio parahaemolyticus TaxID=670 RepID=UPI002112070E
GDGIYGELTEKQRQVLGNINESGNRLMKLIDDILDYARSDVDPAEFDVSLLAVGPLVLGCQSMLASAADSKGLVIDLDIEDEAFRVAA